jgi:hypothetical protein
MGIKYVVSVVAHLRVHTTRAAACLQKRDYKSESTQPFVPRGVATESPIVRTAASPIRSSDQSVTQLQATHKQKSKAIDVAGSGGLQTCEMLTIPHSLDSRLIAGGDVNLTRWPSSAFKKHFFFLSLVLVSVRGWAKSEGLVRLERFGKLKKENQLLHPVPNPRLSGL